MTEIRDGDALSIDIPEGGGSCFVTPHVPSAAAPASVAAACASFDLGAALPSPPGRLVAAGVIGIEGAPRPARFTLTYAPDANATEPTAETAADFAAHETSRCAPAAAVDGGVEAGAVDIVAVGSSPSLGAQVSEVVPLANGLKCAHAAFTLDLREMGRDTPVHFVSYGAWAREGLYVLSVEGDGPHAAAVDALASDAVRTLTLKDPAAPAPSDVARIGARLGQIAVVILVMAAVVVAILGARTRRLRA